MPNEIDIVRRHLNAMLDELAAARATRGEEMSSQATVVHTSSASAIPTRWHHTESRDGETYSWPQLLEEYTRFDVYEGHTSDGAITRWAIGECERVAVWGKDRKYFIVFRLGAGGGSKQPISEFLEADDYDQTRDLVAIIRGAGGPRGQRMFNPTDALPPYYEGMRIETYRDRISQIGGWNKLALVAGEDEPETMLRHAAIQVLLRH